MLEVNSLTEFQKYSSGSLLIIDFYADWCGPCKAISPVFEQLASKHQKSSSVVFAKVNVDRATDVSRACGITAMPTFQFYSKASKIDEVRGADRQSLSSKVERHVAAAGKANAGTGTKLGASGSFQGSAPVSSGTGSLRSLIDIEGCKMLNNSSRSSVKTLVKPSFAGAAVDSATGARLLIHIPFSQAINATSLKLFALKDHMTHAPSKIHVGTNIVDPKDLNSLAKADNIQSYTLFTDDYTNGGTELKFKAAKFQNVKTITIMIDANISDDPESLTKLSQIDLVGSKA